MSLKRWFPILIGSSLAALLLVVGLVVAPTLAQVPGWNGGGMMGRGGMMGYAQNYTGTAGYGCGGQGYGMMGGGFGPGMRGGGMMLNSNSPFYTAAAPLTIAEATEAINSYLSNLNSSNLELEEVMIFDNQAYAEIKEKDTGIGAMELLVDPQTKTVYPEMGPNMMWNLKYGMMSGFEGGYGMRGMMGRFFNNQANVPPKMTVTPEQAVTAARSYLEANFASAKLEVDSQAEQFYGYYTLHVNRDGKPVGMLSVNGYTAAVFPHTWHGKLLEMSED